jgi:ABC-type thiamine transport system ATPase subunit
LSDILAFGDIGMNVGADGQSDVVTGITVSGNYYATLGVQPLLGRVLTDEDDVAAASPWRWPPVTFWRAGRQVWAHLSRFEPNMYFGKAPRRALKRRRSEVASTILHSAGIQSRRISNKPNNKSS